MADQRPVYDPTQLVGSQTETPAAQRIIDANAMHSPLLRLTPELRNYIYALVLGGQDLHIIPASGSLRSHPRVVASICPASGPTVPRCFAPVVLDDNTWWGNDIIPNQRRKHTGVPLLLDLTLLRVCKQIHSEAALLPFLLNTFHCGSPTLLAQFESGLLAAQKPAVQNIVLDFLSVPYAHLDKAEGARLGRLTGLKEITVLFEVYEYSGRLETCIKELDFSLQHLQRVIPWTSVLSVTVRIAHVVGGRPMPVSVEGKELPGSYAVWARRAQDALRITWTQ